MSRRKFMKVTGTATLGGVVYPTAPLSSLHQNPIVPDNRVIVFFEPDFPAVDGIQVQKERLEQALASWNVSFVGVDELKAITYRSEQTVFVNPYGSAFPKAAFGKILQFLEAGGNWVNLGGRPLSVPVTRVANGWQREVHQTSYHKQLGITQSFSVSVDTIASYQLNEEMSESEAFLNSFTAKEFYELYYRFTVTKDFPGEDGTAGARDAIIHTLIFGIDGSGRKLTAPFVRIDRLQGKCAGGRWLLANFKGAIKSKAIRQLVSMALQGASDLVVRPSLACYHDGEEPSFTVRFVRPKGKAEQLTKEAGLLEIFDANGKTIDTIQMSLRGKGSSAVGYADMNRQKRNTLVPGLYNVRARFALQSLDSETFHSVSHTNGFWIFDPTLLEAGTPLTLDKHYFRRDDKPYPVTGTTYMASDVHRKFLFEPNPFVWDRDFDEMQAAGVNMVRTGIWTGWKSYMVDVGALSEASLRAMDAFVLTARKHNMPLIFTFFAFLPEMWGGDNPFLDPRSINAQKEFVKSFTGRYPGVKDIIWDLINEPSFCSPQQLWRTRPNYDSYESAAWKQWLRTRYSAGSEEEFISRMQERYRVAAEDPLSLPRVEDFSDDHIFYDDQPVKVIDYRLFAQDMFSRWVQEMSTAIRSNGNPHQMITVGQDEGGTADRPGPQFFGSSVDFTCIHNWWLNDDLVWDNVMTKVPGKPNLVEETGIMFYEKMDGSPWRTEREAANLLERKLAISLGVGGAGFIQWLWNTNPFMKSDNEAAIGFHRADGTAKPELEPFLRFTRFFAANKHWMTGKRDEDVVMIIPHTQMYSTRDFATEATRRSVRVMHYECQTPMRAISELALGGIENRPALLVYPSPRTFPEETWKKLLDWVHEGTTLLITGILDSDGHWLPVPRAAELGLQASSRPVSPEEFITIDGREYQLGYRGEKIQRLEKAVINSQKQVEVAQISRGKGQILWAPLPVENSDRTDPLAALYRFALRTAHVAPYLTLDPASSAALVYPTIYEDAVLYTLVSECDRDLPLNLTHLESQTSIPVNLRAQRSSLLFVRRKNGEVISRLG